MIKSHGLMQSLSRTIFSLAMVAIGVFGFTEIVLAQSANQDEWLDPQQLKEIVEKTLGEPVGSKRLLPEGRVWINRDEQVVIVDGYVAQRQAQLEMFACPVGTKEHESVVAVYSRSKYVHAALLAVGAEPGKPASFEPFAPARGTTIRVYALWYDKEGKPQGTLAQNWVRRAGTEKPMSWDWVFAGSRIYKDPTEGTESYLADGGELICVANFVTSTLDVSVRSDAANAGLIFDAFTDRIPPRDTPVRLVLKLTDEAPFGSDETDSDAEPTQLKEKIPAEILQFLTDKSSAIETTAPVIPQIKSDADTRVPAKKEAAKPNKK